MNNIERRLKERINQIIMDEFSIARDRGSLDGIESRVKKQIDVAYAKAGAEYFNSFRFSTYVDQTRNVTVIALEVTELGAIK